MGGEICVLVVSGILLQATGTTSSRLSSGNVGVATALVRALLQSGLFLGPGVYLYLGWERGGSVGMRAVGCRLVTDDGGAPPSSAQVLLRMCGLWFCLVSVGLGLAWGWFRRDRRGWSDLFARTVVVQLPAAPAWVPGWLPPNVLPPPGAPPPLSWALAPPPPPPTPASPAPPPSPGSPPHPAAPLLQLPWPAGGAPSQWLAAPRASMDPPRPPAPPLPRTPWTWTDVVPVIVLLLPLSLGVEYATVAAVKWLLRGVALATRRPIEAVTSDITAYGALFLLVLVFVKLRRHASLAALGVRRAEWRWLLAALPFTFAAFVLESISGLLSQGLFPQTPSNQCVSIRDAYEGALVLAVVGVAVVAPLVEELVFRGMVFGWLRGRAPIGWAVVGSAAIFSLEHVGFLQLTLFLPIFCAGLVLATLYHHSRSIWPSVLVHGAFNLVATLVLFNAATC